MLLSQQGFYFWVSFKRDFFVLENNETSYIHSFVPSVESGKAERSGAENEPRDIHAIQGLALEIFFTTPRPSYLRGLPTPFQTFPRHRVKA